MSWQMTRATAYAETLGFKPTDKHCDQIAAARHEVQRRAAQQFEGLIFTKTHQALLVGRGSTTINFNVTAGQFTSSVRTHGSDRRR
jgi:hypothetical protein